MARQTGQYRITGTRGEEVRSFVPYPLPPADPPLVLAGAAAEFHAAAMTALARLSVAESMVLSPDWLLYGFVRKEAVVTSQIEGSKKKVTVPIPPSAEDLGASAGGNKGWDPECRACPAPARGDSD